MILTGQNLPIQTHRDDFRPILCNFSGECEQIHSKIQSIVLTYLQRARAESVGDQSFCDQL